MKKLGFEAEQLLKSMREGKTVTYRHLTGEAWFNNTAPNPPNPHIVVFANSLLELKKAGLIRIKSYDANVLWIIYEAIPIDELKKVSK